MLCQYYWNYSKLLHCSNKLASPLEIMDAHVILMGSQEKF